MKKKGFEIDTFVEKIYRDLYPNSYLGPLVTVPELGATVFEVGLRPWKTDIVPSDVNLSTQIGDVLLNFPMFSAPMDTVTGGQLAKEMSDCGGCGVITRDRDPKVQLDWIKHALSSANCLIAKPKSVTYDDNVGKAQDILDINHFSTIPVLTKAGLLSGMIFTGGIAFNEDRLLEPVSEWMVPFKKLKTAHVNTPFAEIKRRLIKEKNCNVLPLVDDKRRFHGLIFMKDVMRENQSTFNGKPLVGMAVGVSDMDIEQRLLPALEMGIGVVGIDTSHANSKFVIQQTIRVLKTVASFCKEKDLPAPAVIPGNVADVDGYVRLAMLEAGGARVAAVKFGIGCGAICTTSLKTGVGVPLFTCIREAKEAKRRLEKLGMHAPAIIADGGIPGTGAAVVIMAAGADAIMAGSWPVSFSESISALNRIWEDGMVRYRGMASLGAIRARTSNRYDQQGNIKKAPEGVEVLVPHRGSTKKCLHEDSELIRIGLAHVGTPTIEELQAYAIKHRRAFYSFSGGGFSQLNTHGEKVG